MKKYWIGLLIFDAIILANNLVLTMRCIWSNPRNWEMAIQISCLIWMVLLIHWAYKQYERSKQCTRAKISRRRKI
jgi:hypothetical protein